MSRIEEYRLGGLAYRRREAHARAGFQAAERDLSLDAAWTLPRRNTTAQHAQNHRQRDETRNHERGDKR